MYIITYLKNVIKVIYRNCNIKSARQKQLLYLSQCQLSHDPDRHLNPSSDMNEKHKLL